MKRRNFLKLSATASAIGLMPFELNAMLRSVNLNSCDINNRKLVLINLAGGNDGLNTIIPINVYDQYANLRPTLKISNTGSNPYITLDNTLGDNQLVGLHPALTEFKTLYDQGWMRVLQSVGYPSQNKSHFASTDLYATGNDGNSWNNGTDSGWIGRFMEMYYANELSDTYPLAVQIGSNKTSLGFHGEVEHGLAINISGQDPSGFYTELNGLGGSPPSVIPNSDYGLELQYIIDTDNLSNQYSQAISEAFNNGNNASSYPDTDLSNQLKTVARLISGGLESKVYMVRIGGFDTHNSQSQGINTIEGTHNELLKEVSGAVKTFFDDLDAQTLADDVVGLTFSEFGRKAKENGNFGTDHGEIAPMFVFGKPVNGGISGTNVDLSEATATNNYQIETVQFDYRQTFGTLLQNFLGANDAVIDAAFFNHTANQSFSDSKINELIKDSHAVDEGCYSQTLSADQFNTQDPNKKWFIYPNPVGNTLYVYSSLTYSNFAYKVFNSSGQIILQGSYELLDGNLAIDVLPLASGVYFIQIFSENKKETHKILKL
ncbi:DUF1501 domain-containing protein [Flavobacteriaceae bacterium S356]|uniref:DUF1501 domain-containing protein n=1 Tax=Asprobacillus argus TaxID=3076534 RepID=A0ABU3LC31_9FLAO|nr:DUF1501 domain-containing protein [Flavobacteriaceae bacterium S356]